MVNWKTVATKVGITLAVIFAAASITGAIAKKLYDQKLSRAEANATAASQVSARQIKAAHDSIVVAQKHAAKADAQAANAKIDFADFQKAVALAPSAHACDAIVVAADKVIKDLDSAYTEQKQATGVLQAALKATADTLQGMRDASNKLVNVVKSPSLLARLKPDVTVGLGPQVGVDWKGHAYAGVGITAGLSWRFHT